MAAIDARKPLDLGMEIAGLIGAETSAAPACRDSAAVTGSWPSASRYFLNENIVPEGRGSVESSSKDKSYAATLHVNHSRCLRS